MFYKGGKRDELGDPLISLLKAERNWKENMKGKQKVH